MALDKFKNFIKEDNKSVKIKDKITKFFSNAFGFESNVDLSNEVDVLYRRNVVIKNIIFLTNLFYTLILFIISFGDSSNFILTVILLPVTWLVNKTLKGMIFRKPDDLANQKIAMYFACFYMFLSSVLVYIKLKNQFTSTVDNDTQIVIYGEVGYAMLYVSLVVVSLYQDKKALFTICKWLIVGVTIVHFTLTYNFSEQYGHLSESFFRVIKEIVLSDQFKDIVLRTFVLILFMAVLYVNVSISQYLLEERRKELNKRKEVEDDFIEIVYNMFKTELDSFYLSDDEIYEAPLLAEMSKLLANYLGLKPEKCEEVAKYSRIYLDKQFDIEHIKEITNKEEQFEALRKETKLGTTIAKREASKRRIEDLVRNHIQGSATVEFITKMKRIEQSEYDEIIGICDAFISLRSLRSYKRPCSKEQTIDILTKDFKQYFDSTIFERFLNFVDTFDDMYVKFGG